MKKEVNIFWFRRDLRIKDNHGFYRALLSDRAVLPVFIFDSRILNGLDGDDARVPFILDQLNRLQGEFEKQGSALWIYHGKPLDAFKQLLLEYNVGSVFTNRDYEPYAIERDKKIQDFLNEKGVGLHDYKDQVVYDRNDILKKDGKPYTVFTPYCKQWLKKNENEEIKLFPSEKYLRKLFKTKPFRKFHLRDLGFSHKEVPVPCKKISLKVLEEYEHKRDFPDLDATSRIGIHLRFGTISIRELTLLAVKHSKVFLNELIWRNFYMSILWYFPYAEKAAFKKEYDFIPWLNSEKDFKRWCEGRTGYPLVDAGMRQLNQSGFMHNRVRMVTASFLSKHLLIDWRWGEAYFASKLLDYELASNNGGWQWAAGTGCDAAPYFRVFNPKLQQQKFDPEFKFIRKWIPEFDSGNYPKPMIDHKFARKRALDVYQSALKK